MGAALPRLELGGAELAVPLPAGASTGGAGVPGC